MRFFSDWYPDCTTKLTTADPDSIECNEELGFAVTAIEAQISAVVIGTTLFADLLAAAQAIIITFNDNNPNCAEARIEVSDVPGVKYLKITNDLLEGIGLFWRYSFDVDGFGVIQAYQIENVGGLSNPSPDCQEVSQIEVDALKALKQKQLPDTIFYSVTQYYSGADLVVQALPKIAGLNPIFIKWNDIGQIISEASYQSVPTLYGNPKVIPDPILKAKERNGQVIYATNTKQVGIWNKGTLLPYLLQTVIDPANETYIDAILINSQPLTGREVYQPGEVVQGLVHVQTSGSDTYLYIDSQPIALGPVPSPIVDFLQPLTGQQYLWIRYLVTPSLNSSRAILYNGFNIIEDYEVNQLLDTLLACYPVSSGRAYIIGKRNGVADTRLMFYLKTTSTTNTLTDVVLPAFTSLTTHVQNDDGVIVFVGSNPQLIYLARYSSDIVTDTYTIDVSGAVAAVYALQILNGQLLAICRAFDDTPVVYEVTYNTTLTGSSFKFVTAFAQAGGFNLLSQPIAIGLFDLTYMWGVDSLGTFFQTVPIQGKRLCRPCRQYGALDCGFPTQPPVLEGIGYWSIQGDFEVQ